MKILKSGDVVCHKLGGPNLIILDRYQNKYGEPYKELYWARYISNQGVFEKMVVAPEEIEGVV